MGGSVFLSYCYLTVLHGFSRPWNIQTEFKLRQLILDWKRLPFLTMQSSFRRGFEDIHALFCQPPVSDTLNFKAKGALRTISKFSRGVPVVLNSLDCVTAAVWTTVSLFLLMLRRPVNFFDTFGTTVTLRVMSLPRDLGVVGRNVIPGLI